MTILTVLGWWFVVSCLLALLIAACREILLWCAWANSE